jgi:hypothetical protein
MLSTKSKIAKCSTVTLILPRRSRCKLKLEKLAAMHSLTWGFLGSIIYGIIIIVSDRMGFVVPSDVRAYLYAAYFLPCTA